MIFLSAQPDNNYFLWQLQLQVFNFRSLGIEPNKIHILIGYDSITGLNPEFEQWIVNNNEACFYTYEDTRLSSKYASSIRPHIILKHFNSYPELEEEIFFYHDSDIIFTSLPKFNQLFNDDTWYTSDTRGYLDCNYIVNASDENLLSKMCSQVGVTVDHVRSSDYNAGGAQYLFKNCKKSFWEKMENDCEALFLLLEDYNINHRHINDDINVGIQSWCADMWAFWWNALFFDKKFEIHEELNFSWANSDIQSLEINKILHYTGDIEEDDLKNFRKVDYTFYSPFYKTFHEINRSSCSYQLVNLIEKYRKELGKYRKIYPDTTLVIIGITTSNEALQNLYSTVNSFNVFINIKIKVLEIGKISRLNRDKFLEMVDYFFIKGPLDSQQYCELIHNTIVSCETRKIVFYDPNIVLSLTSLVNGLDLLEHQCDPVYIYNDFIYKIDGLSTSIFSKILDPEFFVVNNGKYQVEEQPGRVAALFLDKRRMLEEQITEKNTILFENDRFFLPKNLQLSKMDLAMLKCEMYLLKERAKPSNKSV